MRTRKSRISPLTFSTNKISSWSRQKINNYWFIRVGLATHNNIAMQTVEDQRWWYETNEITKKT